MIYLLFQPVPAAGKAYPLLPDTNNQLSVIDLSEANIVSGGDNYSIKYSTKND